MTVIDKDRGLQRVYDQAKRVERSFEVGIFDRKVNRYAGIIEARFHFMRTAFDRVAGKASKRLRSLHIAITSSSQDPAVIEAEAAEDVAAAIRHSIQSLELIKSGDMLAAISVREAKAK